MIRSRRLVAMLVRRASDVIAIIAGIAMVATTNVGVPVGPLPWVYLVIYCLWHMIRIITHRSRVRRGRANPIVSASETWQDLHLGRPAPTSISTTKRAPTILNPDDPV